MCRVSVCMDPDWAPRGHCHTASLDQLSLTVGWDVGVQVPKWHFQMPSGRYQAGEQVRCTCAICQSFSWPPLSWLRNPPFSLICQVLTRALWPSSQSRNDSSTLFPTLSSDPPPTRILCDSFWDVLVFRNTICCRSGRWDRCALQLPRKFPEDSWLRSNVTAICFVCSRV